MAHIALQEDSLKGLKRDERAYLKGHIALLEIELKEVRRSMRAGRQGR
jgi:hypothetical protein